ncbi:uncharacterized protein LOC122655433 [Telopea speciosissima]|uniref:uncharacterized protein LOC122655433 n=1 Tax=Telopea speciosissima TaxID=54955 RepID=UPI001CC40AB6|nr:uncharacterized protein LOC122655433 [Telopea speciosissima]
MSVKKATPPTPFQLLEINVISAQDLAPGTRNMRTYAVAWVHPGRKLSTRVDSHGHANPTWNDKFVFRVDEQFLNSDTSAVMIEIYALRCFRDVRVGTVRVLVGNLVPPSVRSGGTTHHIGMRFVALQVRRPSGRPQGILNIGVAVLDSSMRSMPLYTHVSASAVGYRDLMGEEAHTPHHSNHPPPKIQLRRTRSERSEACNDTVSQKTGSIVNGSDIGIGRRSSVGGGIPPLKFITAATPNGSTYADSEIGPAPSVVAAGLAVEDFFQANEIGSSILEGWSVEEGSIEGLRSKLDRWRTELPPIYDRGYGTYRTPRRHTRRHTDGEIGGGLFSCFGSSYGCECTFFCGPGSRKKKLGNREKYPQSPSESLVLSKPSRLL